MSVESKSGIGRIVQALFGRRRRGVVRRDPRRDPRRTGQGRRSSLPESCELRDIGSLVL